MNNRFGISDSSYALIISVFEKFPQVETALIFGSRAKGNYRNGSDIDLAIKGNDCTPETASHLSGIINEQIPIPYCVDYCRLRFSKKPGFKSSYRKGRC